MSRFGWAHISGSMSHGLEGSVQYKTGDNKLTGSTNLVFDNASNALTLSGTLNVSGAINANELNLNVTNKTVTNISMTGSTKFGDTTDDQHKFIGTTTLTGASDSALIYQVTASVWPSLTPDQQNPASGGVGNPGDGAASYFYLTSSNATQRGILNYSYHVGEGVSASVADVASFVKSINPALVVSGAAIFKDPVSIQGGLYGASPIDIYAPMIFRRDDLTEESPDEEMRIEQGKFVGNLILSSSNDNHGLWLEGAGYIVMNSKKTLTDGERAPEIVLNNRTSDKNSYSMISQRGMQTVPVAENPYFVQRKGAGHIMGELRFGTEFPVLTGSDSSSAAHYQRTDFDVGRMMVATSPRRGGNAFTFQIMDANWDPEYEGLHAANSTELNVSGWEKPIIRSDSPLYDANNRSDQYSLNNIAIFGGFSNPGQGNEYGMKRGMFLYGNLMPAGWIGGNDSGFANLNTEDCTLGHPVARWGDMFVHEDRYIKWGPTAFKTEGTYYKGFYNSNPLTASARNQHNTVTLGYNSASTFLEVSGAALYAKHNINLPTSGYFNFGTTKGTGGYGLRDNGGILQVKTQAGSWQNLTPTLQGVISNGNVATSPITASTITVTNKVGIGTANPTKTLEVKAGSSGNGINLIAHDNSVAYIQLEAGSAGGYIQVHDSSNNQKVRLDSTSNSWINGGNVGIGTTSPTAKLDVDGNIFVSNLRTIGRDNGTTRNANIQFADVSPLGNHAISFRDGGSDLMLLDGSGKLGIGTTSPTDKLTVVGAISGSSNLLIGGQITGSTMRLTGLIAGTATTSSFLALDSNNNVVLTSSSGGSIGAPEDGSYADGLFKDFTSNFPVGKPIDRFNEVLKIIAPEPAPSLSRSNYDNSDGQDAKLSFDSSNQISGYSNSSTNAGFTAITEDGLYQTETSGSNFRLGIYDGTQDITGFLNYNVAASTTNGNVEYTADAFGNAEIGTLKLELNGAVVHSVNLASFDGTGNPGAGSGTSLLSGTRSGFTNLSTHTSTLDGNGKDWYIFKYRTSKFKIDTLDQRKGWNYARIVHTIDSIDYATNYMEWINDPDGAAAALSVSNARIENVSLAGSKYVSGVKYNTDLTANYKADINNMYRNIYPNGNVITFNVSNSDAISAQSLAVISNSETETKIAQVTGSVNNNQNYLLNGTITVSLNATHPLKSNLSSAGSANITGMLIDNDSSGGNSNLVETFIDEDFRIKSASYGSQTNLTGSAWNSQHHMTSSGASGHEDGMIYYNRRLYNPRDADIPNAGNFSTLANASSGQPNYSSISGTRTYYRKIQNDSGATIRDMKITSQKNGFKFMDDATGLDNNDSHFFVKIPGSTGWMNIRESFSFGSTGDGDGAQIGGASDNSNSGDSAGNAVHCITFGTQSVADDDYIVMKIETNHQMAGYVSQLNFQLGASDVSAPTESSLLDDIDLDDAAGETAKLSFGSSNGVTGYTNVAGGKGSMGAVNSNAVYTDNNDTNRGVFKTIEVMGGTLNEDVSQSSAGAFLNYAAKSFKDAHTGSLLLIVNDATASTLSLSNLTSNNNLSSSTGFSVGAVSYSTTTDGIPDYIKSYRTGTFSIGTGSQRSGWNYARVLHAIGGVETPTNYVQWVIDTSGAVDNTAVTAPTLSDFGHTDIYYQSGIKYYASNPTASFDFEASNFYSNVHSNESNAISFPTSSNCQVTNIRVVGSGVTTFNSGVSQTGMPALDNSADCETTSIQITGTIQYNGATPSIYGSLSTFTDQDVAVNAEVLHPLKTDRATSTANKANLMVYSGSIGSTNLNTEEYFNTETYRIVSGNYANQAAVTSSGNAWNSQTVMNSGGTHDDGLATAAGYVFSPFKIGVAGNTGHASLQAPAGNPDYSSLTNNTRTFYRYFRYTSASTVASFTLTLRGNATLVGKAGTYQAALGANTNCFVELKIPYDPNYSGGDDQSTAWTDCARIFENSNQPNNIGAGIRTGDFSGEDQSIDNNGLALSLTLGNYRIKQNQYVIVKVSAHKDWTGHLSQIEVTY